MFKSKCMFLCSCYLVIGSYANLVPFIDPCQYQDKACLVKSAQKALPYFAVGIPELGVSALDPITVDKVQFKEGGLNIKFKDLTVKGTSRCKIIDIDIDRNKDKQELNIKAECPIEIHGAYKCSGKLLTLDIYGEGPFLVKADNIYISVSAHIKTVIGSDGEKHWKIQKTENVFEVIGKTSMKFDNLFNGDKEKAEPIHALLQQSDKEIMQTVGKPIVNEILNRIVAAIKAFVDKVPASDLEKTSN